MAITRNLTVLCCTLITLFFVFLLPGTAFAQGWRIEVVDTDVGRCVNSLALDSKSYPAISYFDEVNGDLKFARWNGLSWDIETVDSDGVVGYQNSLALDSNDYPAIAYQDYTNTDLKFARWNGTSWDIEVVDNPDIMIEHDLSLALDSNDYPAISYYDHTNENLKFARWNGSSWDIEVVEASWDGGVGVSLALDSNDYPAIGYAHMTDIFNNDHDLKFARWNEDTWEWDIEVVDSDGDIGEYPSLALDSNDYPAISYYDHTNENLKFARYVPLAKVFRGCVNTALSDWRTTRLPLAGDTDDEAPPFPVDTSIPGEVFDDNFPCQEESADLLFYRVLFEGTAPAGNILRAEKVPTGVKLSF